MFLMNWMTSVNSSPSRPVPTQSADYLGETATDRFLSRWWIYLTQGRWVL